MANSITHVPSSAFLNAQKDLALFHALRIVQLVRVHRLTHVTQGKVFEFYRKHFGYGQGLHMRDATLILYIFGELNLLLSVNFSLEVFKLYRMILISRFN